MLEFQRLPAREQELAERPSDVLSTHIVISRHLRRPTRSLRRRQFSFSRCADLRKNPLRCIQIAADSAWSFRPIKTRPGLKDTTDVYRLLSESRSAGQSNQGTNSEDATDLGESSYSSKPWPVLSWSRSVLSTSAFFRSNPNGRIATFSSCDPRRHLYPCRTAQIPL